MKIEAHILNWNEKDIIHLTIKHYQRFCQRIVIYDNYSDDGSDKIAEQMGCEVVKFGTLGELNDGDYLKVKNNCWKGSTADWVIVCDADEILWNPVDVMGIHKYATVIKTYGFNVFSDIIPKKYWLEELNGIPDKNYSKLVCFKPTEIKEINYVYGCHEANPEGTVIYPWATLPLLHYKHVGGADRVADRHAIYAARMSALNKRWKLGYQYQEPREKTIEYFNENIKKAKPIW